MLSTGLALVAELLNSAIEAVVDWISLDRHLLSKPAKDIASAAVFASVCCLLFTFAMLVMPRLVVPLGMQARCWARSGGKLHEGQQRV